MIPGPDKLALGISLLSVNSALPVPLIITALVGLLKVKEKSSAPSKTSLLTDLTTTSISVCPGAKTSVPD